MRNLIEIQKKLIPNAIELMEKRYIILRQISLSQPKSPSQKSKKE